MGLHTLSLRSFRCFRDQSFTFDPHVTVISGENGSGKSSILEAIHLLGTLRSFRTHHPRDMIQDGADACFTQGTFRADDATEDVISVSYNASTRIAKRNTQSLEGRKELLKVVTLITASEPDVAIIQGMPEQRRIFIDHALVTADHAKYDLLQRYHHIARQRASLIAARSFGESYHAWTEACATVTAEVRVARQEMLTRIMEELQQLIAAVPQSLGVESVRAEYRAHGEQDPAAWDPHQLAIREKHARRAVVGAHLDDIELYINGMRARRYASRGFQKLMMLLLKLAHVKVAAPHKPIFLLDDFITDFDAIRMHGVLELLYATDAQLIITTPQSDALTNNAYRGSNITL